MRRPTVAGGLAAIILLPLTLLAQQRDAPAAAASQVGTGEISGVVVSGDAAAVPLRRAVVTITGGTLNARSVLTDEAGRFTLGRLPAGSYSVTARKAAYLAAPYGARRPGRSGMPIALANGQKTVVTIAMFRGAAITGVLRDSSGWPVGGVDVRAIDARTLMTPPELSPDLATTDDRGVFRIYGLLPGDYVIAALPTPGGSGEVVAPSPASIDASLAMLASRRSASAGSPAPATTPVPPQRAIGFAPVFFPGTASYREAAPVHVDSGEERAGVDFELRTVSMASIAGVVSGIPNLAGVQVTLIPSGPRFSTGMSSNSLSGKPMDAQGQFTYSNLPPGSYRLVARARSGEIPPPTTPTLVNGVAPVAIGRGGGSGAADASRPATGDYLYGFADVELRGEDIAGVGLVLQPGGTITGRLVFNGSASTPKPDDLTKMRVSVALEGAGGMVSSNGLIMGSSLVSSPISSVKADGTFEVHGIGPGRFTITATVPAGPIAAAWKLRTAMADDRNLLDDVLELGPGTDIRDVVITFSDARTEISGTLQGNTGAVTTDYYIVAIPADRALWRPKSPRILSVRPATDGRFVFGDLPSGEYMIAALTDLDPIDLMDASFLEQIAAAGFKVTVAEGEKKVQNLQIR